MNYWYGAQKKIGDKQNLCKLSDYFTDDSKVIKKSGDMTVLLRKVYVDKYYDLPLSDPTWKNKGKIGSNDLMVLTTYTFDKEPEIDRLHYLKNNTKEREINTFFNELVLAKQDFRSDKFKFRLKVYDVDRISPEIMESITAVSDSSAVIFPELGALTFGMKTVADNIVKVINKVNKHDCILDSELILRRSEEKSGDCLLQEGFFVCFSEKLTDEEMNNTYLHNDLVLRSKTGEEFSKSSYGIVEVKKEYQVDKTWQIEQKVAKLMSEIKGNGMSGEAPLHFLKDTLEGYANFKKIKRGNDIGQRIKDQLQVPAEEIELYKRFKADDEIGPYII
ncbi:MAG: hypothetical protein JEZ08_01325 [Clostridiales bacterium]|nr:hypothetical protein [Clostridiales bacterium]